MRVEPILHKICRPCSGQVHARRLRVVVAFAAAVIAVGRLNVTAIGRGMCRKGRPKHGIKRADRLLSNSHLFAERALFWSSICSRLIDPVARPVIIVDWTKVVDGYYALVAAVPSSGRALPIYLEVHPEHAHGGRRVVDTFLCRLRDILPKRCSPILVADAQFRCPFFTKVRELGWDYVVRVRGRVLMRYSKDGPTFFNYELFSGAKSIPSDLGQLQTHFARQPATLHRVVLFKARERRARRRKRGYPAPSNRQHHESIRSAREPWVLATSLPVEFDAVRIVAVYSTRMQIEETFRDSKNLRFGWCLRHVRSRALQRLETLLLLAALATLAVTLVGLEAERVGYHRGYQANTVRRRALSLFVLGCMVVRRNEPFPLTLLAPVFQRLHDLVRSHVPLALPS